MNQCDQKANSTSFVEFLLSLILEAIEKIIETEKKITVNQKLIIKEIEKNPFITQKELSTIIGISKTNIIKNMKKLQEIGIIARVGADKNGHWKVF